MWCRVEGISDHYFKLIVITVFPFQRGRFVSVSEEIPQCRMEMMRLGPFEFMKRYHKLIINKYLNTIAYLCGHAHNFGILALRDFVRIIFFFLKKKSFETGRYPTSWIRFPC